MRSRGDRDSQRRRDVEFLVQPADGTILSRSDRQSISLLGVWGAAGQRSRGNTEPQQFAGAECSRLAAYASGRRKRLCRARPGEFRNYLWRICRAAGFSQRGSPADTADADVSRRLSPDVDFAAGFFGDRAACAVLQRASFVSNGGWGKFVAKDQP